VIRIRIIVLGVTDSVTQMDVTRDGSLLALGDCSGHVSVYSLPATTVLANLPSRNAVPTSLSFPSLHALYGAYSDKTVSKRGHWLVRPTL